ncbi:MAG: aspartate kinase [Bacteroidota bacterium]
MTTINLVIFGIGNVGSTLINQIQLAKPRLIEHHGIDIQIPVIANSKLAFFSNDLNYHWETDFKQFSIPYKIEDVVAYVSSKKLQNLIAVDATASEELVKDYSTLIQHGFHIVAANKVANTLHHDFYDQLRRDLKKHDKQFLYETNVGAGLPVIETIKNLYQSGELITKVRGVFSGSLSYIFNAYSEEDTLFSEVLSAADQQGLTEPDARDDLSGKDVARKLLILARELGLKTELSSVKVRSLVSNQLNGKTSLHQFKQRIKELDPEFETIKTRLKQDQVLRYVGELDIASKQMEVKLVSEYKNTSLGQLKGTDTIFEIYTEGYNEQPLVIQGAGAGKHVTARGVLSDVIKISQQLKD